MLTAGPGISIDAHQDGRPQSPYVINGWADLDSPLPVTMTPGTGMSVSMRCSEARTCFSADDGLLYDEPTGVFSAHLSGDDDNALSIAIDNGLLLPSRPVPGGHGSRWRAGYGAPKVQTGDRDGDMYLDQNSDSIWLMTVSGWVRQFSLGGATPNEPWFVGSAATQKAVTNAYQALTWKCEGSSGMWSIPIAATGTTVAPPVDKRGWYEVHAEVQYKLAAARDYVGAVARAHVGSAAGALSPNVDGSFTSSPAGWAQATVDDVWLLGPADNVVEVAVNQAGTGSVDVLADTRTRMTVKWMGPA